MFVKNFNFIASCIEHGETWQYFVVPWRRKKWNWNGNRIQCAWNDAIAGQCPLCRFIYRKEKRFGIIFIRNVWRVNGDFFLRHYCVTWISSRSNDPSLSLIPNLLSVACVNIPAPYFGLNWLNKSSLILRSFFAAQFAW